MTLMVTQCIKASILKVCSFQKHWILQSCQLVSWVSFLGAPVRGRGGEGNGNPLQCSCLENPRDGGAWWATVYGVAESWIQLKWLSSGSSSSNKGWGNEIRKDWKSRNSSVIKQVGYWSLVPLGHSERY